MGLVDQYGFALSSSKFYKSADNFSGRVPPEILRPLDPLRKLITRGDWLTLSFLSEKLLSNAIGAVAQSIIDAKAMAAVGTAWRPVFMGQNAEWGKEATRWLLEEWYPTCSVEGSAYDFVTGLYMDSTCIDGVADAIVILTRNDDGKGAWPQLQRIPSRQCGQRDSEEFVTSGPYKGYRIENGVIRNGQRRPVAYRILGETEAEDRDIDAFHVRHIFEPRHLQQSRGLPIFAPVLESFRSIAQSEEWERQAMLIASAIGLIETNETGSFEGGPGGEEDLFRDSSGKSAPPEIRNMWGGMVRYIKANSGGKLEQFTSNRPAAEYTEFCDRHVRMACAAANWSYNTAWKTETVNGVGWRSELGKNKMAVCDRQALLRPHAAGQVGYAVSVAMQPGPKNEAPILPPYTGPDKGGFLKWGFIMPAKISVDEGRDRAQRRADAAAGYINDSQIVEAENECTYEEHVRNRWRDVATRERVRQEVELETGIPLDPREGKMLTPNEQSAPEEDPAQNENPPKSKP